MSARYGGRQSVSNQNAARTANDPSDCGGRAQPLRKGGRGRAQRGGGSTGCDARSSSLQRIGDGSQSFDESVVVCVRADEIPQGSIAGADTDSAPVETDARRENRLGGVDLLELETGVPRVSHPSAICLECLLLDMGRKIRKELPEPFGGSGNHAPSPLLESRPPRTPEAPRRPEPRVGLGWRRMPPSSAALTPVRRGEVKRRRPAPCSGAWMLPQKPVQEVESWPTVCPLHGFGASARSRLTLSYPDQAHLVFPDLAHDGKGIVRLAAPPEREQQDRHG